MGAQSSKASSEPGSAELKAELKKLWAQRMQNKLRQQQAEEEDASAMQSGSCHADSASSSPTRRIRPHHSASFKEFVRKSPKPGRTARDASPHGFNRSKTALSGDDFSSISWSKLLNPACWTASKNSTLSASQLQLDGLSCPSLPVDMMENVALRVLAGMDTSRRPRTQSDPHQGELLQSVLASAISHASIATLRLVCQSWCVAATQAVLDIPAYLSPEQALRPTGRWAAQSRYIRSIGVVIPYEALLDRYVDPNVYQQDLEIKLRERYPNLREIRWQVQDVLRLVNERMSWVVTTAQPSWFLWVRGLDKYEFVDVPSLIRDSVICAESSQRQVKISIECDGKKLPWTACLHGPVTVQRLMDGVCAAGKEPADAPQRAKLARRLALYNLTAEDIQRRVEHATRWDVVPQHKYFQDLTLMGGVYNLSIGPHA